MASCVLPSGVPLRDLRRLVKLTIIDYPADVQRPRTRGECAPGVGERPCPWISCRMHLALEVTAKGNVKVDKRWEAGTMPQTCALDVAEAGEHTLEEVGQIVGFTRERVCQVQEIARRKASSKIAHTILEHLPEVVVQLPRKLRAL